MSKEIDGYLKSLLKDVPDKLNRFYTSNEKSMVYYVGNFAEDILNNFTEKQSEKLFLKVRKFHDDFYFYQKKLNKDLEGYEYIVQKK